MGTCLVYLENLVYLVCWRAMGGFLIICNLIFGSSCSAAQSCLTLWDPTDCGTQTAANFSQSLLKLMLIESVMPSNHRILCCPLLPLPSIFPSNRVFSSEWALHIRWPKYWSFSFSISPSHEYSELISFRIDWFDLLAVQGLGMFKNKHKHIYTQIISYHYRVTYITNGHQNFYFILFSPVIDGSGE